MGLTSQEQVLKVHMLEQNSAVQYTHVRPDQVGSVDFRARRDCFLPIDRNLRQQTRNLLPTN